MSIKTGLAILEGFALLLGLCDVTGWSRKLETWIDDDRLRFFQWLAQRRNEAIYNGIQPWISYALTLLGAWSLYTLITSSSHAGLALTLSWLVYLVALALLFIFFIVVPLCYKLLFQMNRAASGTVGTVSFVVALASFVLTHLDGIWGSAVYAFQTGLRLITRTSA